MATFFSCTSKPIVANPPWPFPPQAAGHIAQAHHAYADLYFRFSSAAALLHPFRSLFFFQFCSILSSIEIPPRSPGRCFSSLFCPGPFPGSFSTATPASLLFLQRIAKGEYPLHGDRAVVSRHHQLIFPIFRENIQLTGEVIMGMPCAAYSRLLRTLPLKSPIRCMPSDDTAISARL